MNDSVQIVEQMYPQTAAEFKAMTDEMYKVFCAKMYDYGANNIALGRDLDDEHNKKMSLMGIWFRSNDKMSRIENLLRRKDDAVNESLEDSYLDLANYSVIASIVRKNLWGK
jgi:hypothetical protein